MCVCEVCVCVCVCVCVHVVVIEWLYGGHTPHSHPSLPPPSVGDKIPADIRVTKILSTTLKVDQAILTGDIHTMLHIA